MKLLIIKTNYADEFNITDTLLLTPEDEILWQEGIAKLSPTEDLEIYFGANEYLTISKYDILHFKIVEIPDEVVEFLKKYRLTDTLVADRIFDAIISTDQLDDEEDD